MGKSCDLCERSATRGATRSHSKRQTLKRQHINLQPRTVAGIKIKVCTSCLRTVRKIERETIAKEEAIKAASAAKKKAAPKKATAPKKKTAAPKKKTAAKK